MGRKISNDRVRKIRKRKNKILIAVEGTNKTEKIYFSNFDDGKKTYTITIAKGNDTDPLGMIKLLSKEIDKRDIDLSNGDIAFCVFDTDINSKKNKIIKDAINLAKEKGIRIITSTPCIELQFLLHFEYTTARLSNNEVMKRLKKYLPKYQKNINIFSDIKDKVYDAIERAKRLESFQLQNNKIIGMVEANPSTEMYKIVEELIKQRITSQKSSQIY